MIFLSGGNKPKDSAPAALEMVKLSRQEKTEWKKICIRKEKRKNRL